MLHRHSALLDIFQNVVYCRYELLSGSLQNVIVLFIRLYVNEGCFRFVLLIVVFAFKINVFCGKFEWSEVCTASIEVWNVGFISKPLYWSRNGKNYLEWNFFNNFTHTVLIGTYFKTIIWMVFLKCFPTGILGIKRGCHLRFQIIMHPTQQNGLVPQLDTFTTEILINI